MAKETHDQKRKRKLAERRKREKAREDRTLAYSGDKYKTPGLSHVWLHTEVGIYETDIILDRNFTDQQVWEGVEQLIATLQGDALPDTSGESEVKAQDDSDLMIVNIRRNWENGFGEKNRPSKDQLIGVLRSILGTIQLMKTPAHDRGYLNYMGRFLSQNAGVSVRKVETLRDSEALPGTDVPD